jgi:carbon storage regulator
MLVLSRKCDESIIIDDTIRLTVLRIKGNKVRLGITTPTGVRVDREEVHNRILESRFNEQAALQQKPAQQ